jgi:hypothetical protein
MLSGLLVFMMTPVSAAATLRWSARIGIEFALAVIVRRTKSPSDEEVLLFCVPTAATQFLITFIVSHSSPSV